MGREATRNQDFPLDHGSGQKSPLPPFFKGGLGGISERVRPNMISSPFSRFFILPGQATHHVLFEQSRIFGGEPQFFGGPQFFGFRIQAFIQAHKKKGENHVRFDQEK
jgi:hypothetical protein